jgi:hypothetical protein
VQSNDTSINLITCVNFLRTICLKSCVALQALLLSIFQPHYKEPTCFLECLFIFSLWISLYSLLYQNEAMSALDQLRARASKREVELRREFSWATDTMNRMYYDNFPWFPSKTNMKPKNNKIRTFKEPKTQLFDGLNSLINFSFRTKTNSKPTTMTKKE